MVEISVNVSNIIGRYENLNIDKLTCLNVSRLKSWCSTVDSNTAERPQDEF